MLPYLQGLVLLLAGALGYGLTTVDGRTERSLKVLNPLNGWALIPLLFFMGVVDRGLDLVDADMYLLLATYLALVIPVTLVAGRRWERSLLGSVVLAACLMNSVNLPFSLLLVLQGTYSFAATFASGVSFLRPLVAMGTYRFLVGKSKGAGVRTYVQGSLSIAGVVVGGIVHLFVEVPDTVVQLSTVMALSLIIFSFGVTLRVVGLELSPEHRSGLKFVALVRSVLSVVIVVLLGYFVFLKGHPVALREVALESSMPPAVTDSVFARIYDFDVKFTVLATLVLLPLNAPESVAVYYLVKLVLR